jgi:hypothetical protein
LRVGVEQLRSRKRFLVRLQNGVFYCGTGKREV